MRLFISYAHADRSRANDLAAACREAGHDVFIDERLQSGRTFRDDLERELKAADAVVVIWTKRSTRSDWVREEAQLARSRGTYRPVGIGVDPPFGFREAHTPKLSLTSSAADVLRALDLTARDVPPTPTPDPGPDPRRNDDLDWYGRSGTLGRLTRWITKPR